MLRASQIPVAPLFVPGDKPALFPKAAASHTDAIIIDLEDAVVPTSKAAARNALADHGILGRPVIVRINSAASSWFEDDLGALKRAKIDAIMLPKAEGADQIASIHRRLESILPIIPLIETARGLALLQETLGAVGVVVAAFGSLDFALDMNCSADWQPLLMARSEIVFRSRLAGLPGPVDGVTPSLTDMEIVSREAREARELGFRGKLAIHPSQLAPIMAAMKPSERDVLWAEAVLKAVGSDGAFKIDGAMIDAPQIARAERIVRQSERR
jgi:citrate lyase subunit beta / citryl-CoA lyase